jgi:hypothetical protein
VKARPDAALEVALDQRRRRLDQERRVLAERELLVQQQAALLDSAEARVRMVLTQIDDAQQPAEGVALPVDLLGDLEHLLQWCEVQVTVQQQHLEVVRTEADKARGMVATAHQQVRALELVLEARAAERAEKARREEVRLADETAAQVHVRNRAMAR